MKKGLFVRISLIGMRKNKRLYVPYIISGICMIATYYILSALSTSETVRSMGGGRTATSAMYLGKYVILLFALIFIFYVNSFLVKQRMKEFGLYNVLGMEKKNLIRILFWDSFLCAAASLLLGMGTGIGLEKLSELILAKIVKSEVGYSLSISFEALSNDLLYFAIIYILVFFVSCIKILRSNPLQLIGTEAAGEKPPKANWVLALLGIIILGGAYFLAVYIDTPGEAILLFFLAALMVIVATLLLFTAGSVALCRLLKNNTGYYYKASHFVSVSQMTYRMKRNGASLALICILATMVMVMLAGSGGLYFSAEEQFKVEYGHANCLVLNYSDIEDFRENHEEKVLAACNDVFRDNDITPESTDYAYIYSLTGVGENNVFSVGAEDVEISIFTDNSHIGRILVMEVGDYNRMFGTDYSLSGTDILVQEKDGKEREFTKEYLCINGVRFNTVGTVDRFLENGLEEYSTVKRFGIVVSDLHVFDSIIEEYELSSGKEKNGVIYKMFYYGYDVPLGRASEIYGLINRNGAEAGEHNKNGGYTFYSVCMEEEREYFYGLYGGLFFLGILLSTVFIIATVLVLFYKQIAEGYEDRKRFEIMRKVGMTKKEIKKSINSQMRTVFLLPLIMAVIHLSFSLPMIYTMLSTLYLDSLSTVLTVAGISAAVFAVGYIAVYKLTSRSYYKIVTE